MAQKPDADLYERYQVQDNDSEFSIAQKFNTSVGLLRKLNARMSATYAKAGRKIYVPKQK